MTFGMKFTAFALSYLLAVAVGDEVASIHNLARDAGASSGIVGPDNRNDPPKGKSIWLAAGTDPAIVVGNGNDGPVASSGTNVGKDDTTRQGDALQVASSSSSSSSSSIFLDPSLPLKSGSTVGGQLGRDKNRKVSTRSEETVVEEGAMTFVLSQKESDSHSRPGLRGLSSVQRFLPNFRLGSHSKQSKQHDRHPSKSYRPPKTSRGHASHDDDDDCDNYSSSKVMGKGGAVKGKTSKGKSSSYKNLKGHEHSKKSHKASSKCSGKGCLPSKVMSSKTSSKCESGKGKSCGPSKTKSSKGSSKVSSKCGSGTGSCGGTSSKTSSPPPVKCPTTEPTSNIIEDRCEKECMDWVHENCVVLDEMGNVLEEHCVVPFPFDDDLYGRSLMATSPFSTTEEELQYHQRMIGIYESVLSIIT